MGLVTTRAMRKQLERDNAKWPTVLREIPRAEWPEPEAPQLRVLRSRDFLVQEFPAATPALVRLSVCRTAIRGDRWQDGIAWEDLQKLKGECGYGHLDAIEIYPNEGDVVNVANMRHIWVMAERVACAWRRQTSANDQVQP